MAYSIRKNWISTSEMLSKNSIVFMPFVLIAFLECLVLEVSYFSARFPLSKIIGPIIRKFFGEQFLHYPGNLVLVPKLFYYGQVAIYILAGVFLSAISIQIVVNIRTGHPVILKAIVKTTAKRYMSFVGYGLIYIILMGILEKTEGIAFLKAARFTTRHIFKISPQVYSIGSATLSFLSFIIVQTFLMLTIPIIIMEKKNLFKAILGSLSVSARNFLKILCLILVPLLLYLPVIFMKNFLPAFMDKTFPEISFYITLLGAVMAIFVDCFVITSVTQVLLDTKKAK